jgi:hypothetical protein
LQGQKKKVKTGYNVVFLKVYCFQKKEKKNTIYEYAENEKQEKHVSHISSKRFWAPNSNYYMLLGAE